MRGDFTLIVRLSVTDCRGRAKIRYKYYRPVFEGFSNYNNFPLQKNGKGIELVYEQDVIDLKENKFKIQLLNFKNSFT